jgi:hypothetical protein
MRACGHAAGRPRLALHKSSDSSSDRSGDRSSDPGDICFDFRICGMKRTCRYLPSDSYMLFPAHMSHKLRAVLHLLSIAISNGSKV